jgi:predicted nucleic acid-binding protein
VILLDTTPLVALCDPRDRLNATALRDLDRLARRRLIVCDPVLTETAFHLSHRAQRERLHRFLVDFDVQVHACADPAAFRLEVLAWLVRYEQHSPDLADGYLAVASFHERSARVWSYDGEFRTIWRRPDGTRIPLAVTG